MKTTQNLKRVKELLLTPPTFSDNKARLQTNLDTDFLKLIAIVSMLIDHIGSVFFPEVRVLRWIGRLAWVCQVFCVSFKKIFWGGEPPHLY
ncbi:TraX family protein, partial [Hungatella hathewayi]|uniref:TraX family protein n=1 Tax=Hungatella hathewayi TaxID=154046 RepID=UPI001FA972D8